MLGTKPRAMPREVGARDDDLEQEAGADDRDERDDQRLEQPEALVLQVEHDQDVERRDRDAPGERDPEEQVEGDGRADHLGQVAGGDGDLAQDPQSRATRVASSGRDRPARGRAR